MGNNKMATVAVTLTRRESSHITSVVARTWRGSTRITGKNLVHRLINPKIGFTFQKSWRAYSYNASGRQIIILYLPRRILSPWGSSLLLFYHTINLSILLYYNLCLLSQFIHFIMLYTV